MNANAYGGELARVLEWVDVVSAGGTERAGPDQLGFAYRRSNLRPGEVVARASFALDRGAERRGQGDAGRHARAAQGRAAVRDQDVRLDLQEPRRPAGRGPDRRPAARRGRLPRAADRRRRASRPSTRTSSRTTATRRTADVIALMAEGRRRVQGAVRRRARARGAGARAGRVPARLEPGDERADSTAAAAGRGGVATGDAGCAAPRPRRGARPAGGPGRCVLLARRRGCGCATPRWSPSSSVTITGVSGPDAGQIRSALDARPPAT